MLYSTLLFSRLPCHAAGTSKVLFRDTRRLLSSSYKGGKSTASGSTGNGARSSTDSFRNVRQLLAERRPTAGTRASKYELERTLFRREEPIAQRFVGPLAMFNVAGALVFASTILQEGHRERTEPVVQDGADRTPSDLERVVAVVFAGATAVAVVVAAQRFSKARLVELRSVGNRQLKLYTRSMSGFPTVAHEAARGEVGCDFSRLRAAQKAAEGDASSRRNAREANVPYVTFRVPAGDSSKPDVVYTIDSLDAAVLDVDGIENLTKDIGKPQ